MARSNIDNSNQEDSQQGNREDSEPSKNSYSFYRRNATRSVSTEYHSSEFQSSQPSIQVHLKIHLVLREGKRILVPHYLKDQEPPGAEDAKILVVSQIISRS